jgi:hypothetical protein
MPALRAWGRRWLVADDDFVVVGSVPCFVHFAFIPPLIAWFALVRNPQSSCDSQMEFTVAFSGILVSYTVSFLLELAMVVLGFRGTPLDEKGSNRRSRMSTLVHLDTISHIIQVAFVGYLSYLGAVTFKKYCFTEVPWNDDAFIWSVVGVFWTYCLFYLIFVIFCWDCSGKHKHANECWDTTYMNALWLSILWFAWNPFSKKMRQFHRERALRVGKNMKSLFGHCDMSLSDFVLGFMNARHRAKHAVTAEMNRHCSLEENLLQSGEIADIDSTQLVSGDDSAVLTLESLLLAGVYRNTQIHGDPVESEVLQEVAYYFKYALAAYGWMLYFLGKGLFPGLWAVIFGGRGIYFPMFRGKVNLEISCRVIGTDESDILFIREQGDKENVLCYVIAADHEKKSIILSVRGAITVDDNVKDILLDPSELDGWLDAAAQGSWDTRPPEIRRIPEPSESSSTKTTCRFIAQGDYLETCHKTLCDILDTGILEAALCDHVGYALTFAGHSLGAVGSFFLALYFQKWVPNVRCWCYSPPAGLVDISIAESCGSWCTSIANGKEIVPRFSAANLDRARDQIVCSLASVNESKWRLLYKLLWKYWTLYKEQEDSTRPIDPEELSVETKQFLQDYITSRNEDKHRRYLVGSANRMSLPGRVIYFEPKPKEAGNGQEDSGLFDFNLGVVLPNERQYVPKYVSNSAMRNQGILLSGRIMSDHMPDYAEEVINKTCCRV